MLQSTPCLCSFLQASTPSQVEASLMYSRSGPMPREPYRSTRRIACGEGEGQGVEGKQGLSVCGAQGVGHTVYIKHKCLGGGITAVDVQLLRTYAMGAVQVNKVHCLQSSEGPRSGTNAGVKRAMQCLVGGRNSRDSCTYQQAQDEWGGVDAGENKGVVVMPA